MLEITLTSQKISVLKIGLMKNFQIAKPNKKKIGASLSGFQEDGFTFRGSFLYKLKFNTRIWKCLEKPHLSSFLAKNLIKT